MNNWISNTIFISLSFFTFSCLRLDQHLVNQGDLSPLVHTFQRSWLWRLASQSQLYHSGCRVLLWLFLRKTTKKAVIWIIRPIRPVFRLPLDSLLVWSPFFMASDLLYLLVLIGCKWHPHVSHQLHALSPIHTNSFCSQFAHSPTRSDY